MIVPQRGFHPVSFFSLFLLAVLATVAQAEETVSYQRPPESIAKIIDAPWTPRVEVGPDKKAMLVLDYPGLPGIAEVAMPEVRLAGLRINPRTNGPSRVWYHSDIRLRTINDRTEHTITGLPSPANITDVTWSPDGGYVAFAHTTGDQVQLWLIDIADRTARRLMDQPLNAANGGSPFRWMSDSRTLVARLIPDGRPTPPETPLAPSGPNVQENLGGKTPARTYQDLLENPHDEALFEFYTSSQIALVAIDGAITPVGKPGIFAESSPSPDNRYLLVETIHRPFSYTVPAESFPRTIEVWDTTGRLVKQIADLPLADRVPITFGSVPTGPRDVSWRADADATLYWAEALDEGDAAIETDERDRVFMLAAPFTAAPTPLLTIDVRFAGIEWANDNLALASGWWWKTRRTKTWRIYPGAPSTEPAVIEDRSYEDRYTDPGSPMSTRTARGTYVMITAGDGSTIFLSGTGASSEGNRPFVDQYDLSSGEKTRLFRSEAPFYESPLDFLDVEKRLLLTRRESPDEPPNYFQRDLRHNDLKQITFFLHPTPQLKDVTKELVKYTRHDGVQLTGTLYLPPKYDPKRDGPLPMLMWAYPEEYKSADAAGQVKDSPYRFIRVSWSSPLVWLAEGYAVLDNPSMPIIGEGDAEPNDSYIEQLVADAQAAVDEMTRRGIADPKRIAVGGHSYGAFMTANLLAHSDLFAAGIARSGAYNRTLTPFGFQSEERTFWQAPDIYFEMSPFMHAQRVNEPILLIHGEADNNPGTYPMQTERFYAALKGHGATARMVLLPHESHGYRARESVMHVLWEMHRWMEMYVKNPPQAEPGAVKSMTGQG